MTENNQVAVGELPLGRERAGMRFSRGGVIPVRGRTPVGPTTVGQMRVTWDATPARGEPFSVATCSARIWYISHLPHEGGCGLQLRAGRVNRAFRPSQAHMRQAWG